MSKSTSRDNRSGSDYEPMSWTKFNAIQSVATRREEYRTLVTMYVNTRDMLAVMAKRLEAAGRLYTGQGESLGGSPNGEPPSTRKKQKNRSQDQDRDQDQDQGVPGYVDVALMFKRAIKLSQSVEAYYDSPCALEIVDEMREACRELRAAMEPPKTYAYVRVTNRRIGKSVQFQHHTVDQALESVHGSSVSKLAPEHRDEYQVVTSDSPITEHK